MKKTSMWMSLLAAVFAVVPLAPQAKAAQQGGMSPEETIKSLTVAEGLELTVWASEPGMVKPTNIDIDARGRVWVCEGVNYRGQMLRPEGDRIMILEDTKGTGTCDSYKVFVQDKEIRVPLGICVLGNKVYVSQSPKLLVYTIDASGDKPAGPPEVYFEGFGGNNHDHGLHALLFGPDGRYYFNSGNEHNGTGNMKNGKGEPVVDSTGSNPWPRGTQWRGKPKQGGQGYKGGMAFRCNPDGSGFETLGYNFRNNFEVTVDSFGTAWQSDNDDDGNQGVRIAYVMEGGNFGYVEPHGWSQDLGLYKQTRQEAEWHQRVPGIVPNLLHTGGGSPTGICVYEGDLLPERFRGNLLHCDAGPNVVRAYIPTPYGAGYKMESIEVVKGGGDKGDKWFRPSDVCVAADGSVLIADWHDPVVGGHQMRDNKLANISGRIYRLAPPGHKASIPKTDLESVAGQVAALCSPNLATRYMGYNKLAAGGEPAVKALKELYKSAPNLRLKARALWMLARSPDGPAEVKEALKDSNVDIRITALRAARLIKMDMVAIAKEMLNDPSPFVARELCLAMNYEPTEKCMDVLVSLADKVDPAAPESPEYDPNKNAKSAAQLHEEDTERQERVKNRWYLEAFGIACTGREEEVLAAWLKDGKNKDPKTVEVVTWRLKRIMPDKNAVIVPPKPEKKKKEEVKPK